MRPWLIRILAVIVCLAGGTRMYAQDQMRLPPDVRAWFRNPDGSCVQCSIGMTGAWLNQPAATTLLWDSDYGNKVRGGSYPSRVEAYADKRNIPIYNITGRETYDWMKWASKTGRMSAIGAGRAHFQTLIYYDPTDKAEPWKVCNNNSPKQIDSYSEKGFKNLHEASGLWVVILKTPSPPMYPSYVEWWR